MAKKETTKQAGEWPPGLSNPAKNALEHAGITRMSQLPKHTEKEIATLHGMGPKGIRILKAALQEKGLTFKVGKK